MERLLRILSRIVHCVNRTGRVSERAHRAPTWRDKVASPYCIGRNNCRCVTIPLSVGNEREHALHGPKERVVGKPRSPLGNSKSEQVVRTSILEKRQCRVGSRSIKATFHLFIALHRIRLVRPHACTRNPDSALCRPTALGILPVARRMRVVWGLNLRPGPPMAGNWTSCPTSTSGPSAAAAACAERGGV